ncbi:hypothetical protein, partial [Cohnella mopanensis]|uniref:hypothetical protein n=1 Tax=Cohnella mopanensis TaxID=2911966 RepID=UPI001EF8128C
MEKYRSKLSIMIMIALICQLGINAFLTEPAHAAANAIPVLTASGGSSAFVSGNNVTSTPVVIDSGITVSDLDNTTLASATVAITGNLHSGEDVLGFINDGVTNGNITASYNALTGVMTLTSSGASA